MGAFKTVRTVSFLALVCRLEFPRLKLYIILERFGVFEGEGKPIVTLHFPKDLKFTKDSICVYILIYLLICIVLREQDHILISIHSYVFSYPCFLI